MRRLLILLAALVATPVLADPTEPELAAAREAEARGAEIYAYDQAAWHSTDRMQADLKKRKWTLEKAQQEGMAGYVVEPAGDGQLLATYYGVKDGKTFAMARYRVRGSKVERGGFLKDGDDAALSPLALRLVEMRGKAVDAAIEQKVFRCTRGNLNTVVLPPRADGTIPAYVMSSAVEAGLFPAGGHYRYVFGADGKLLSSRAFSKSCVNVDSRNVPKKAAGFGVSHLLDPQPTEIHVFVSYNVPITLFVITQSNSNLWEVARGKVTFKQVMKDPI
ncbi:MAG: hypothetical protein GXC70_04710 [Sphingomonadaceae bacterium]|nr:hypothetical protein [Sphingomonadaceae bacterium]